MQMREHGLLRRPAFDPSERGCNGKMAWVRRVAERIQDPEVESFKMRQRFLRQLVKVAGVGHAAYFDPKRIDVAVDLPEGPESNFAPRPADRDGAVIFDEVAGHDWRVVRSWR